MYIVLELAEGGELFEKIIQKHKFNEKENGLIYIKSFLSDSIFSIL